MKTVNNRQHQKKVFKEKKKLMYMNLILSLDVAQVTDHSASLILTPKIANVREDPENYKAISQFLRHNKKEKEISEKLKILKSKNFDADNPLVVHCNGKLLEDITGKEVVDRLLVVLSENGFSQLIGIP